MFTIKQLGSDGSEGFSDFEFRTLEETIKKCHELNMTWLLDHYEGNGFILTHIPVKVE